ncbi:hypothetical protein CWO85_03285 [Candidatus Phytoplasma ziziphi]|uniref:Uncharacterized protein n=2 Tax=Acholeplasmataceae TaxID=2146 RepID=A0A660HNE5_ZIZJU|nr:hypothetical protein CWO85_03285 [Candidatus Phytoplasma ziziphi]
MNNFALGFIIGSLFNLFVIWFNNKIYQPKNHDTSKEKSFKKLLKEVEEQLRQQKDQQLKDFSKDLSLTIKNLHINPHKKENKNVVDPNQEKEKKEHFSLIHHNQQEY